MKSTYMVRMMLIGVECVKNKQASVVIVKSRDRNSEKIALPFDPGYFEMLSFPSNGMLPGRID